MCGNDATSPMKTLFPFFLFAWIGLLLPTASWGKDIRVSASVNNTEISLEDVLDVEVVVEGTQDAPQPEPPALPAFSVRTGGRASSLQIINGQRTASTTFHYQLIPKQPGDFTIGPFKFEIDGNPYITAPIPITVRKGPAPKQGDRAVFAEATVPTHQPYVNELLPVTLKVYRKASVRNVKVDFPLDDFRKEELGPLKQYSRVLNGIHYDVYEWNTGIYPLKAGKETIPSALIELDVVEQTPSNGRRSGDPFFDDPFFQSPFFHNQLKLKHKVLRTEPIELEVLPLPEKNRPEPFSNLVGQFKLETEFSRTQLAQGDTMTLTVTVTGEGNPQDAVFELPETSGDFKVYADQPEFTRTGGDKTVAGKKVFKYALVPLKAGTLTFPSVTLNFFDPRVHAYRTIETEPQAVQVTPGETGSNLNAVEPQAERSQSGTPRQKITEDINPLHAVKEDFTNQIRGPLFWVTAAVALLVPPAFFLIFVRAHRQRQRMKFDTAYKRRMGAFRQAEKRLNRLASEKNGDDRETVRELSQIVRTYIGDRLNLNGTAFTSREVEDQLRQREFQEEHIVETRDLLEKYESLQYAAGQANTQALLAESRRLLEKLEEA